MTIKSLMTVPFKKLKNTKAWKFTSLLVRQKSKGICYTCEKKYPIKKLNAGHFIDKIGHAGTYFDLDNLRAQCFYCNRRRHGELGKYGLKLRKEIGDKRVDDLFKKANKPKLWSKEELKKIAEEREIIKNKKVEEK